MIDLHSALAFARVVLHELRRPKETPMPHDVTLRVVEEAK